jgi:pectate lyase
MGAVVKVESCYFENTDDPIGWFEGPQTGSWDVLDNVFVSCVGSQPTTSTGMLPIPYEYAVDAAADVPAIVTASAGVGK